MIGGIFKHVIWGILIAIFVAVMIFGVILQDRIRGKARRGDSILSPLPAFRALGIPETYLLIVFMFTGVLIGVSQELRVLIGICELKDGLLRR
jgi:hypothetical protein